MDTSKINQKEIDYNLNLINSEVNIANGRLLLECPIMSVGSSSFQIDLALIYNSKYLPTDFNNIKIGIGNGWKFNIEEYVYKYEESFELENFTSNDYVYIDSSLKIHRFIKYKETSEGTYYYDENKASLKLLVNNDKKEIIDIANNRKLFNANGNLYEVIDGQNEAIKKCLVYNNGLLKEIYDKRKQVRKIVFEYNNKKELVSITCNKKKIELIYEESRLSKVKKIVDKKSKYLYEFKYNEYLEYVIELESILALKFSYLEGKVKEVIKGALKESLILTNGDNYVKEDQYVNDKLYLSSLNKDTYKKYYHIPKKYYHIPNEYIKSKTLFDYNYAYTDVTNEKNIITRHYLNTNDFVTVSFERIQDNNKTLFKTSGFELLRGGGGSEKINGKRSKAIGQDKIIHLDNVMEFSKKFEPYDNGSESKDKYTENYVLSFFIKGNIDISDFIEAKFNYIINNVKFTCNSTYLTKTKASAWQYVTMPVTFNDNKDKISDLYLEFKNVSFKYQTSNDYVLKNINLKFNVGSKLAIVGMNGSGKTTFIKLLCRLYDPTEGEILLNGIDIKKYNYLEYLMIFSVVFQDFQLLSLKLGENVASSINYDSCVVEDCLIRAGFKDKLRKLNNNLNTYLYKQINEKGINMSGGEVQKIAIARALYKDSPFIILDEPTASLDPIAEAEIYSKFNEIVGDKTAIYISHRLSSCIFCDEVVVFDNGHIVQHDTHKNLLEDKKGKYYELWHAQAQYYK